MSVTLAWRGATSVPAASGLLRVGAAGSRVDNKAIVVRINDASSSSSTIPDCGRASARPRSPPASAVGARAR